MAEIRVFISSVQAEFAEERKLLYDYIRQDVLLGQFFTPFIFEKMPAVDLTAQQAYLQEAADCDIYIGLYGLRYGYEDADGVSPTEREYDTATAHHAHRLVYIKETTEERNPKEQALIHKVEQDVVRRSFTTYDDLRTAVYSSLVRYLEQKEIIRRLPFDATAHPTATWDAIDTERVRSFVDLARKKRNFPLDESAGLEKIFSAINVLTEDGRLTNSALLLFAKEPQHYFPTSEVKCVQFYGTEVEKPIKNYQVYRGSLFEMIDQAVAFVMSRIDAEVGSRDGGASAPITYEIPERVVSEAIVNAVAHRDYTSNASVQVMLFRDRLEIWNPGHLPYGLTPAKLRQLHSSDPTNPIIAHPLFLTAHIDRIGTGTTDIIKFSEQAGLASPEFVQDESFRVIIWRKTNRVDSEMHRVEPETNRVDAKTNRVSAETNRVKLSKKQLKVIAYCSEPRTAREIIETCLELSYQTRTVKKYVTDLVNLDLLRPLYPESLHAPVQKYIEVQKE